MLEASHTKPVDPGLLILLLSLRYHGVDAEVEPVRRRYGAATIGIAEMLRCARDFGLKARAPKAKWKDFARMPMPVIAALRNNTFLLIIRIIGSKVVVVLPNSSRPETMARADFEKIWNRRVVLMMPRSWVSRLVRRLTRPFSNMIALDAQQQLAHAVDEGMVDAATEPAEDDQSKSHDPGL